MTPAAMLERSQWDGFWLPPDVTVVDRPELLLRTCPRPAPHLNAVVRTRADGTNAAALVAEVEGHFRGRRGRWMLPDTFDSVVLIGALAGAGWRENEHYEVRALPVEEWHRSARVVAAPVDSMARLRDAVRVGNAAFGRVETSTDAELAQDLRACVEGGRVHRFVAYDADGAAMATGGLTAFADLGFGLLWGGGALPNARGKGAYSAVLGARIERAKALGLTTVGLYAKRETSAPIVARMGFRAAGEMRDWERDIPA